ncbi:MAG: hypothetical protein V1874_16580 [Spirochaetota bacterium]
MKINLIFKIFIYAVCCTMIFNPGRLLAQAKTETDAAVKRKILPDISLILDFGATYRNMKNEKYESLEIPEFTHSHGEEEEGEHSHEGMNAKRGFNFNYGELVMSAAVDPYFDLFAAFHLSEEGFEVEEGFINTRSLPGGVQMKAGKFLSSFGRANSQHAHFWAFNDRPIAYKAFFGDEGLLEKGAQIGWTLPTSFYLFIGGEILQGENEASFGYEGYSNDSAEVKTSKRPNVYTGFAKTSFDAGSLSVLFGASGAFGKARINHELEDDSGHAVYGDAMVLGGDIVMKYFFDSYRYLSLEGEYLYRSIEGDLYEAETGGTTVSDIEKKQSGYYAQLIARPFTVWRMGIRYESLINNSVKAGGVKSGAEKVLPKYSAMLEYNPTEFSRLRLQYNYDRSLFLEEKRKPVHEVALTFNMSIGAHGAHSF